MDSATAKIDALADLLKPAFAPAAFRVDRKRPLTFVCGGKETNDPKSLRDQFLENIKRSPLQIVPLLAERTFAHQLVERNLQKFEQFLAETAECVLVFVESPGSFAETGLFAALNRIAQKTFIVNTRDLNKELSFLNTGPIKLIRKTSCFDEVFELADKRVTDTETDEIVRMIVTNCTKYKNALVFHPEPRFPDLDLRLQLGCIHLAVTLLVAASADLVASVLQRRFKGADLLLIERLLSLLTGLELLSRSDELYFNTHPEAPNNDTLIASVNFPSDDLKMRALSWQARNNSHAAVFIREKLQFDI